VITVAKSIDKLKYDPEIGSFQRLALVQDHALANRRSVSQTRTRQRETSSFFDDHATATIERVPTSGGIDLDAVWETEWKENLFEAAIARVKKQIEPKQFQIFRLLRAQRMAAQKGRRRDLESISGQVYLARHRVWRAVEEEIKGDGKERWLIRSFPRIASHPAACVKSAIPDQVTGSETNHSRSRIAARDRSRRLR
jgi:RNA polymerase sigma-70 factor (ECF subfamily)